MNKESSLEVLKIGTDICSLARIEKAYKKFGQRFLEKVLTENEIEYVTSAPKHLISRLAVRFAAKEACVKALGTGWYGVGFQEIEIGRKKTGEPLVILHNRADQKARELGLSKFQVSLSHEKDFAVAFVVAY